MDLTMPLTRADDQGADRPRLSAPLSGTRPEEGPAMLVTAICDACHRPLLQQATNLQLQAGELISTTTGVQMRNNQSPE